MLFALLLLVQDTLDTRTFRLKFKVEEKISKVTKMALWVTTDEGKTWKTPEDAGVKADWSPAENGSIRCAIIVPTDGLWGFTGQFGDESSQMAEPPKAGEAPFVRLRVDTKGGGGLSWMAPKGGETWEGGASVQLQWTTTRGEWKDRSAALYYSVDGAAWTMITKGLDPAGFYFWSVPNTATANLKLRVTAVSKSGAEVESVGGVITVKVVERPNIPAAKGYADRARILAAQSRFAPAAEAYEKALALWPDYPEALNDLGWVYAEQKQPAKALEYFLRARKASPSSPHPYINAATMELRLGLGEDAMKDVADAVELGVDSDERLALRAGELLWKIAVMHALAEEWSEVERACELILRIRLADKTIRKKAAEFLRSKGR